MSILKMAKQLLYRLNIITSLGICTMLFCLNQNITIPAFASPSTKFSLVGNFLIASNVSPQRFQPMHSVMFNFRPEVPLEKQDALLAKINTWNGISSAAHLKSDAQNATLLRMCYAYVSSQEEQEVIVEYLLELPEIESASIPAERRLL